MWTIHNYLIASSFLEFELNLAAEGLARLPSDCYCDKKANFPVSVSTGSRPIDPHQTHSQDAKVFEPFAQPSSSDQGENKILGGTS